MKRFMRNLVVLVAFALVAVACGKEGGLVVNTTTTTIATTTTTTTTTIVPTTTTTEPPTSTTMLGDFALAVDMTFAYRVEADGTCVTTSYEGVNYGGFIAEGAEVVIEDLATGEVIGSYPLGEGTEQPSRYGPDVCRFETTASLPVDGSYRYYLADDTAGFDGTYTGEEDDGADFGGHLFYPLGVEVGQGIYLVPPEVYATAVPIWYSDAARALPGFLVRKDDELVGVGFSLPTGTVLSNPIEGFWEVRSGDWKNTAYVDVDHPRLGSRHVYILPLPFDTPREEYEEGDPSLRIIYAEGTVSGPALQQDPRVPIGFGQTIGRVTSSRHLLPILVDEVEVLVEIFSFNEEIGYMLSSADATLRFFPYLDVEQPVSDWSPGVTVVVSEDCDACDEILAELDAAPDSLEIHIVDLENRVVRYNGIRETPTVIARGPGEFDMIARTGLDAVSQLDALVEKACEWLNC